MKETRWLMFVTLPVIVLAVAAFLLMGRSAGARAEDALELLLSSTPEEAQKLEELLAIPAVPGDAAGLVSLDDQAWMAFLSERYGRCMTEECIAQQAANRSISHSARLAKELGTAIKASELSLTKRPGEGSVYSFTALLTADGSSAAQVSGSIEMAKVRGGWKAQKITLN